MRSPILLGVAVLALACSKEPAPGGTDFARGGIPDDSVKTAPIAKTAPVVKPTLAPAPTPTFTAARTGIPDDSIKPIAPAPAPTPR